MPEAVAGRLPDYESFIADHSDAFDWPALDERTASSLCYTSGTTGHPKGVLYSHRSNVLHAYAGCMSDAELKDRKATLATKLITVPINEGASSGDRTIRTIQAGQLFSVYGFWLKAGGAVDIIWKSGSTSISGTISLSSGEVVSVFQEVPVLKGRARGDDLILNLSTTVSVRGWVNLTEAAS